MQYVPESQIAEDFGSALSTTKLAIRSYGFTAEPSYLEVTRKMLTEVHTALAAAQKLSDENPSLVKLREHLAQITPAIKEWEQAIDSTEAKNKEIIVDRDRLNQ